MKAIGCLEIAAGAALGVLSGGASSGAALLTAGQACTVVCFGDSVTGVYYHSGDHRAWPELLGAALRRIEPGAAVTVINAGVSGNTTAQGLARMDRDVLAHHPQLVVAMFGLNDVALGKGPEEYAANLREIARRSRAAGAKVVLMTPNSIYPGDPARPPERVGVYAGVMREVGRELGVPVADAFAAFEAVRAADPQAWERLMSETIHPNLFGHALFASEAAWTITGRRCWLDPLPVGPAPLAALRAKLRSGRPVRIVAMPPTGEAAAAAIHAAFPAAVATVESWEVAGQSLADIAARGKALNRFVGREPDLVVVAVPSTAGAPDAGDYFRSYSWILNYAQAFGPGHWDCVVVSPERAQAPLSAGQKTDERIAEEAARSKDIPWVEGSDRLAAQLESWLR